MATQATSYYGRIDRAETTGHGAARAWKNRHNPYSLRALPNEDVYLFRKTIDNSRVVREADPQARWRCWKLMITTCLATLALMCLLWPNVHMLLVGYQIEALKQQAQLLQLQQSELELEEARLMNPERLEELARIQQFVDPEPGQVVHLNPRADGALAHNIPAR